MPYEKPPNPDHGSKRWRRVCACSGRSDVDGGYAFVVLAATFIVFGVTVGQSLVTNLYFTVFLHVFRGSHFLTSFVGSTMTTVMYLFGSFVPMILDSLGARYTMMIGGVMASAGLVLTAFAHHIWVVFLTYGFLLDCVLFLMIPCIEHLLIRKFLSDSAGCCLSFCGGLKAISMYFSKRLSLAMGIATCGSGVGLFLIGPLLQWSKDYYGWRGLLFINAGVTLQMTLCGALVFPKDESKHQTKIPLNGIKEEHMMSYRERLVDKRALCLSFISFLQGMGILFVFVVLKDLLEYFGQDSSYTICIMVIGITSTAFRIISSTLTGYVSPLLVHAALLAVVSLGTFLLIVPNMGEVFYVSIAVMLGIGQAIYTTLPVVVADIFGRAEMAPTYAILQVYAGIGTIIGPPVGGYIRDVTGSYNGGMILCGAILTVGSVTSIALEIYQRRHAHQNSLQMEVELPLQEKNAFVKH